MNANFGQKILKFFVKFFCFYLHWTIRCSWRCERQQKFWLRVWSLRSRERCSEFPRSRCSVPEPERRWRRGRRLQGGSFFRRRNEASWKGEPDVGREPGIRGCSNTQPVYTKKFQFWKVFREMVTVLKIN